VILAKAIAAEGKTHGVAAGDSLTRDDIERDLQMAAERKQAIDDDKSRKAGADYKHVGIKLSCIPMDASTLMSVLHPGHGGSRAEVRLIVLLRSYSYHTYI
jgi:hypothetical protein